MSVPITEPVVTPAAVATNTTNAPVVPVKPAAPAAPVEPEGTDALGDAGKKALDAMKADRNAAKAEAAALQAQLADMKAKAEGREAEHAAQIAAQKVKDDALSAANQRILKAEFRAAAAGKLADPADALKFITDMSAFEVGADGEVNASAIAAAIEDLIKTKPYLAAATAPKFGSADAGVRNGAAPSQLSKTDVERLYAEKKYDEIAKAQSEGRLNTLLGVKS